MKTKTTASIALSAGLAITPAIAHSETREGFELGVDAFDYNYREDIAGETVVYDDGTFGGFHLSYVETIGSELFLRAKVSADAGSVDYRSPDPAGEVRLENVKQSIGQFEMQVGLDLPIGRTATLSPFIGFGSRVLLDESGGKISEDGFFGYDREIQYGYVPIGFGFRVPVTASGAALLVSAQYNHIFHGTAESKYSELDSEIPDIKLDLDGGHGLEASAAYQMPFGNRAISAGPFIRQWQLNRSDSLVIPNPENPSEGFELYEPDNETREIGFRVSLAF